MKLGQWLGLICLAIALVVLWQVREMLLLVFAAVVLATALNSLTRRFQQLKLSRGLAIFLTLGLTVLVSILFAALIVPPFVDQFVQLIRLVPNAFIKMVDQLEQIIDQRPSWFPEVRLPSTAELTRELQPFAQNLAQELFTLFSTSLNAVLKCLLVLVLTLMMLANPTAYRHAFIKLFPSFYRRRADEILTRCEIALGNWMAGLVISSSFVAALSAIGLWILQVRFVLANALLAGLLNFIPNIGPTLSVGFPMTVALLDAPWKALAVLAYYLVIQQVESYFLTPTVMAQQVSLLPALTLIAQIFFASFFGLLGLLLALPLTVVAKTWIEETLMKDILDQWELNPWAIAINPALAGQPITPSPMPPDEVPPPVQLPSPANLTTHLPNGSTALDTPTDSPTVD